MIGISSIEVFNKHEIALLKAASDMVRAVPEKKVLRVHRLFDRVRCHELALAVGKLLGLQVVDGHVIDQFGIMEHSWLLTAKGNILDVYTPSRMPMVQLVHSDRWDMFHTYKPAKIKLNYALSPKLERELVRAMQKPYKLHRARLREALRLVADIETKQDHGTKTISKKKSSSRKP